MRVLVACHECKRQYDAGKLEEGSRFRCLCGATLLVHRPQPHEASVVRCSSCGAPRQRASSSCRFCGADFTLHERDLHTVCPSCMARVSDRARFCHHCAAPLVSAGAAGEPSESSCPVCGDGRLLTSRRIGDPGIGVLECPRCAGLWLSGEEFRLVLDKARERSPATESAILADAETHRPTRPLAQEGPLYRPCPICHKLMHRRNFGRKSGIIVDQCRAHGFWFDARELEGVLRWVRRGGEIGAARLEAEERRQDKRRQELDRQLEPTDTEWPSASGGEGRFIDFLSWLAGRILYR